MTRSKYRNVPTIVDGIRFASKKEAARYRELMLLERAGEIRDLELQKRYKLRVNDHDICTYVCDFRYWDEKLKEVVVEDVKGVTRGAAYATFQLKAKLMKAILGVTIKET